MNVKINDRLPFFFLPFTFLLSVFPSSYVCICWGDQNSGANITFKTASDARGSKRGLLSTKLTLSKQMTFKIIHGRSQEDEAEMEMGRRANPPTLVSQSFLFLASTIHRSAVTIAITITTTVVEKQKIKKKKKKNRKKTKQFTSWWTLAVGVMRRVSGPPGTHTTKCRVTW